MNMKFGFAAAIFGLLGLGACATHADYSNSGDSGFHQSAAGIGTAPAPRTGVNMRCPADGTNSAGMAWRPGEYCIPGDGGNH